MAVGTIYNYYPAKGDLIADVVERFWKQAVTDELMRPFPGEGFVEFCERLSHELHGIFGGFRDTWLVQMAMMDRPSLEESRRKEAAYFEHVRAGLEAVLASDARVDPGRVRRPIHAQRPVRLRVGVDRGLASPRRRPAERIVCAASAHVVPRVSKPRRHSL